MKNSYLISVGINLYDNFQTLGLCVNDSEYLSRSIQKRLPETTVKVINDGTCTPDANTIIEEIKKISSLKLGANDIVVFYFAGHGFSSDGKDYVTAKNTNINDLSTAISTDDIITGLKRSSAGNVILIIDACRTSIDRGPQIFGESTAELSRRLGIVTFFSCSPGETAKELPNINGGVFTRSFSELLENIEIPFTPFIFNERLIERVEELCKSNKLTKQTPYTAVAPLEKAVFDPFSGKRHSANEKKKELILILGPSNSGKTTIGQFLAREHGYIHAEMSSYAWQRFNASKGYTGSILDFMENQVWTKGNEDAIARDLIKSDIGEGKLVVCGARRMEEIETILSQGWEVTPIYVFANASERFRRIQHSSGRFGPSYEEFIKKDLKEFSWGIARMAQIKNVEFLINETDIENCYEKILSIIKK